MFTKAIDYVLLFTPMISGFLMSAICPMSSDSGESVPFRPPSWVFGVVWTILYLLLGLSWVIARNEGLSSTLPDILYSGITLSLVLWLVVYSCFGQKINSIYVFSLCFFFVIAALFVGNLTSKLIVLPLLIWLIYAFSLNTFQSIIDSE